MGRYNETLVSASILAADFGNLESDIKRAEDAGADMIHVDVMDGHFVPNITIGPGVVESIKKFARVPLDVHLMIENTENFIEPFIEAGADIITVHYESCGIENSARIMEHIIKQGIKAAIAFNPNAKHSEIIEALDYILTKNGENSIYMVLLMTVFPGFGGQGFIPESLENVIVTESFREERNETFHIQVDGGIGPDNARDISEAGADIIVAGTAVFRAPNIVEAVKAIKGS